MERLIIILFYQIRFLIKSVLWQVYMALYYSILLYDVPCYLLERHAEIKHRYKYAVHTTQKMILKVAYFVNILNSRVI